MMTETSTLWETKRTVETRKIEEVLRQAGFDRVDAYRYNIAAIRVRVIDSRFENMRIEDRDAMVDQHLSKLPDETQRDIMSLLTFAPSELQPTSRRSFHQNLEFDEPSPSIL